MEGGPPAAAYRMMTLQPPPKVIGPTTQVRLYQAFGELKPDVIFCDIGLPEVDGYEIARTLRRDGDLRSTYLVALSGYTQPEDRSRAAEAGFDAHRAKPADIDELAALVAQVPLRPS